MQVREVTVVSKEGQQTKRKEVWDGVLQAWRQIQPLDQIKEEKQTQDKYVCGGCGGKVEVKTVFTGWEVESIDPETGEELGVLDAERDDIHNREYRCLEGGCDWIAGTEWYDDIKYAEYKAQEKEEAQLAPWFHKTPFRFTDTFEPF